jgi:hypothetical protein
VYKVRHTSGIADRKEEAITARGMAQKIGELFAKQAVQMMQIDGGTNIVDHVINILWEKPDQSASDRQVNAWADRRSKIQQIYASDTCVGGFGHNGWTVWNSITEYLDHHRPRSNAKKRALATMDPDGQVVKLKDKAAQYILATV